VQLNILRFLDLRTGHIYWVFVPYATGIGTLLTMEWLIVQLTSHLLCCVQG